MGLNWLHNGFFPFYYCLCLDKKQWKKEMKKMGCPKEPYPVSESGIARTNRFTGGDLNGITFIVTMNLTEKQLEDKLGVYALLAHEATHIVDWTLEYIGEEKPGKETRAYMTQFVTLNLMNAFEKQTDE